MPLSRVRSLVVALVAVLLTVGPASAEPMSVPAFLELKPRWERLIGSKFQIEGRVSAAGENTLLMRNLTGLNFHSKEKLPDLSGKDTVEVHGRLGRGNEDQLVFNIESVRKSISDMDRLNRLRVDLPADKPEEWYGLANWAVARGTFYKDLELTNRGRELYVAGLKREHTRLEVKDHRSLSRLASRVAELQLSETLRIEYLYEGNYRDWQNERLEATSLQLAGIAERASRELPGAANPLPNLPEAMRKAWDESPLFSYHALESTNARQQYHRLLYQAIMLQSIEVDADRDGKNGKEIAQRLRARLPEFGALADRYIADEQNWRLKNVRSLSQAEMLQLQREFEELNETVKARQTFTDWFQHQELELLKQPGVGGLVDLADLYDQLMDDQPEAISLLLRADRQKPGLAIVGERLEAYGYKFMDGEWLHPNEVKSRRNTAVNMAMREGRVVQGMTAEQVTSTLGQPAAKTRLLTGRNVIEYWVFGKSGARMAVRLRRLANRRDATVVGITQLGQ